MTPDNAAERRDLSWSFLGRVRYLEALDLQVRLRRALLRGEGGEVLLLLEHPHVFTLGRNARREDVVAPPEWLAARGIEVCETDRGGQVTYHGPGQLVGYPILNLSPDRRDVRRYVRDLQEVLVRTLNDFGVVARGGEESERIGVWVGERKIASIGVHLKRWITTHGFALNVATDLALFRGIVPCGLSASTMISMSELLPAAPTVEVVAERCGERFAEVFGRRPVAVEAVDLLSCAPAGGGPGQDRRPGRRSVVST